MTEEAFVALLEARIDRMRQTLAKKAQEYAGPQDRLYNFKRSAELLRSSPESACLGFLAKHLTSITDMVYQVGGRKPTAEQVDEKIGDAINYLVLLEALFKETDHALALPGPCDP